MKIDLRSQTLEDIELQFAEWGEPRYRAVQVLDWVYKRFAIGWEEMTNIPKLLRARLAEQYDCEPIALIRKQGSADTTQKFLWKLADGALIESVLIPANPALYGEASDRHTLCVSSQVGCAYGCRFCASGLDGWKRNLEPHEIVEQVLAVERWAREQPSETPASTKERLINNIVMMGMGEPLANYDHVLKALTILNASWGGGIGARKITISTSGLAPQIRKLAAEPFQFRLAISLHGATDAVRNLIMPINKKYPLQELTSACEFYQEKKNGMITLEYILIQGINDGLDQTKPLANLARKLHAKINLIPYNTVDGLPWERPDEKHQDEFAESLRRFGVAATLRREKGHDIDAACGQLRLRTERELLAV